MSTFDELDKKVAELKAQTTPVRIVRGHDLASIDQALREHWDPLKVPVTAIGHGLSIGSGTAEIILTPISETKIRIVYPSGEGGEFDANELAKVIATFVSQRL